MIQRMKYQKKLEKILNEINITELNIYPDIVYPKDNIIYTISTSSKQKKDFIESKYTAINLGVCETKLKKVYIGDEIEVYGIQALFCEIPGTLPSNNANPESFTFVSGGACYNYFSQRKYLDPTDSDYVGDEESQKYRKLQINKKFDLF